MRKLKKGRKFSRKKDARKALLRSLVESLFIHQRIKTTLAKAKEARMLAEKLITKAKKNDLSAIRELRCYFDKDLVEKITKEIAVQYKDRKGGYTRIIKLEPRTRDASQMAILELIK